jgi:hypothetical protein
LPTTNTFLFQALNIELLYFPLSLQIGHQTLIMASNRFLYNEISSYGEIRYEVSIISICLFSQLSCGCNFLIRLLHFRLNKF